MDITNIIRLLCGVSLFLFGMNLMGNGLKRVAGKKLEIILYKLTSTPFKGILLGTGVTAVIQSSSATSVMVVGFVNSGMMKVRQAIGIIMGAIIGTSITGWVICLSAVNGSGIFTILSTDTLTAVMAIVGIILLMFTKKESNHNVSYILLGFAVLMFGISAMTEAVYPLRESEMFIDLLTSFKNPLIGILTGLVFTCLIQSASAAVGILQTLAVTGAISFQLALPVIMGIAIGASVPVLLSALGANANGKRTALIYLLVDTIGAVVFGIIFYSVNAFAHFNIMNRVMNMADIALLNTVFRILIVLLLFPFIGVLEKIVTGLIVDKDGSRVELRDLERLDDRFVNHPALAIEQTKAAVDSMARYACEGINEALDLISGYSDDAAARVYELEDITDIYEDKIGAYLVRIMKSETDEDQNRSISMILHSITDLERIGDHAKNLSESAKEISEKNIVFSDDAAKELSDLSAAIRDILNNTMEAFVNDDASSGNKIEPLEEVIDNMCDEFKAHHVERIQNGICEYSHGFVFNDILSDLERVGDHCSNLGIAVRIKNGQMNNSHHDMKNHDIGKTEKYDEYYSGYTKMYFRQ